MNNSEIIYFEFNMWEPGRFYPDEEPFRSWVELGENDSYPLLDNEEWVKENELCVAICLIDQSVNYCVSATKEWVEKTCPKLLTHYSQFLRHPNKQGNILGQWGTIFLPYVVDNIGTIQYVEGL